MWATASAADQHDDVVSQPSIWTSRDSGAWSGNRWQAPPGGGGQRAGGIVLFAPIPVASRCCRQPDVERRRDVMRRPAHPPPTESRPRMCGQPPRTGGLGSCLVCRHIIGASERPLHGPDVNAQPVGDGPIVETVATQVAYLFPPHSSLFSPHGGARLPRGWRHDLRRQIRRGDGAAVGAVAPTAGPGDATASAALDPAFPADLSANPAAAPREVIGTVGIAAPAVAFRHEPGDGGVGAFGGGTGNRTPHGDGLALSGLPAGDAEALVPGGPSPGCAVGASDGLDVGFAAEEMGRFRRVWPGRHDAGERRRLGAVEVVPPGSPLLGRQQLAYVIGRCGGPWRPRDMGSACDQWWYGRGGASQAWFLHGGGAVFAFPSLCRCGHGIRFGLPSGHSRR